MDKYIGFDIDSKKTVNCPRDSGMMIRMMAFRLAKTGRAATRYLSRSGCI